MTTLHPFSVTEPRPVQVEALLSAYERQIQRRSNRLFELLLGGQWIFAIAVAAMWSPRAWTGTVATVHPHLLAAIAVGGLLTLPPVFLIRLRPHDALTHHIVAAAQVGFSTLLIHLTGGRIETHFHVFGSLAFLALYRDWRLLLTATVIVALDHLLRGIWFPSSVYGVPYATAWRTVEHAAWVLFEDAVLVWACVASRREMREICQQQDARTALLENLEERVQSRTAELAEEAAQHKETATELRASEERFRNLVTHAPIGIFKTLRNGEILVANPHLLSMLALPADVALKNLSMRSGQLFDAEARERMWQHLLHGGELRAYEAQLRRTDGSLVDVLINGRLIDFDVPGGPACEGTVEDVTERKQAERELDRVHRQLVTASRQAGMAEVATGVLHNVGNVLTSVNLTLHDVQERLRKSPLAHLTRVAGVLQRERPRLPEFLTVDPAGRQLPDFVSKLATHLETENQTLQADISSLTGHFEHIRDIVVTQQSAARMIGLIEALDPVQLLDDALALHAKSHDRHRITIECDHAPTGLVLADRHKVLQILVNLLQNAKEALLTVSQETRRITLRVAAAGPETVAIVVADNGPGIAPEHRARLFQHGFTTKKNGHGFGLHSCVLAAREMKGDLTVESAGPGCGATFTLSLPLARVSPVAVATPVAETALV